MELRAKLYDMKNDRKKAIDEAKALVLAGKLNSEEYTAKTELVSKLSGEIDQVEALLAQDEQLGGEPAGNHAGVKAAALSGQEEDTHAKAVKAIADAARKGFQGDDEPSSSMMNEGVGADGGYTVPEDIVTDIISLRESRESLLDEVTVKQVTTKSGRRTIKKRGQHTGFATVAEAAKMGKVGNTPQFAKLSYEIEKRRGYLPVTNELMEDSDAAIASVATEWLADEARVTANREILAVVAQKEAVDLTDLDGILAAWVRLGSAFRKISKLITNDDGLLWLGTLKDGNGRYLLTPNPAKPEALQLVVGPHVLPVKTYDNDTIPTIDGKIPMLLGTLKEGIIYWDRRQFTLELSKSGVVGDLNALEEDLTLWIGSMRDDCSMRDDGAFINGYIYLDPADGSNSPAPTLGELTVTSAAGTDSGTTALTVSQAKAEGHVYKYKIGDAAMNVTAGQNVTSWSVWDGTSDITAATGKVITLVEASADYKAVKVGTVTVTAKE